MSYCIDNAVDFINAVYEVHHTATLVHCQEGISQSPLLVTAYLILTEKMRYQQAYEHVALADPSLAPTSTSKRSSEH
ncbi:hypothetical protein EON65_07720 [archaeon]|nr:MAG: hypothetical protein EON65_07720 [archaeon]